MDHEATKTAYGTADDYEMIFKRKSFHIFRGLGGEKLSDEELAQIEAAFDGFARLCPEIRTAIRTVPAGKVQFKHDAEYCILPRLHSEFYKVLYSRFRFLPLFPNIHSVSSAEPCRAH